MTRSEMRQYLRTVLGVNDDDRLYTDTRLNLLLERAHDGLVNLVMQTRPDFYASTVDLVAEGTTRSYILGVTSANITNQALAGKVAKIIEVRDSQLPGLHFLDTMNDVDETALENHVPDVGGPQGWKVDNTPAAIVIEERTPLTDIVAEVRTGVSGGQGGVITRDGVTNTGSATQDIFTLYVDINYNDQGGNNLGLIFRASEEAGNYQQNGDGWEVEITDNVSNDLIDIRIRQRIAGTILEQHPAASFGWTAVPMVRGQAIDGSTGFRFGIDVSGSEITLWREPYGGGLRLTVGQEDVDLITDSASATDDLNDVTHTRIGIPRTSTTEIDNTFENITFLDVGLNITDIFGGELTYARPEDLEGTVGPFYTVSDTDDEKVIRVSKGVGDVGQDLFLRYGRWPDAFDSDIQPPGIPSQFHELVPLEALFTFEIGNESRVPDVLKTRWQERRQAFLVHVDGPVVRDEDRGDQDISIRAGMRQYLRTLLGVTTQDFIHTDSRLNAMLREAHHGIIAKMRRWNPEHFQKLASLPVATVNGEEEAVLPADFSGVLTVHGDSVDDSEYFEVPLSDLRNFSATGHRYAIFVGADGTQTMRMPVGDVQPAMDVLYTFWPGAFDSDDKAPPGLKAEYFEIVALEALFATGIKGDSRGSKEDSIARSVPRVYQVRWQERSEDLRQWVQTKALTKRFKTSMGLDATGAASDTGFGDVDTIIGLMRSFAGLVDTDPQYTNQRLLVFLRTAIKTLAQDVERMKPDFFHRSVQLPVKVSSGAVAADHIYEFYIGVTDPTGDIGHTPDFTRVLELREFKTTVALEQQDGRVLEEIRHEAFQDAFGDQYIISHAPAAGRYQIRTSRATTAYPALWMKYTFGPHSTDRELTFGDIPLVTEGWADLFAMKAITYMPGPVTQQLSPLFSFNLADRWAQFMERIGSMTTDHLRQPDARGTDLWDYSGAFL